MPLWMFGLVVATVAAVSAFVTLTLSVPADGAAAAKFAPAGRAPGRPARDVAVHSHFSKIATTIKDKGLLVDSLNDMGLKPLENVLVRGYQGETMEAEVVLQQENNYDVGFKWNGKEYEIVSDMQFWQQSTPPEVFLEKLSQRYALNNIKTTTEEAGFQLVDQRVDEQGVIHVAVERWGGAGTGVARKFVNSAPARLPRTAQRLNTPPVAMSHFTKVKTTIKDSGLLRKSLVDMGLKVHDDVLVRGYQGETMEAELVVQQENGKDIGFQFNGESYELVGDLQFWQQSVPQELFVERLTQRYAINTIQQSSEEAGFQLVDQKVEVDGTVVVNVERMATSF